MENFFQVGFFFHFGYGTIVMVLSLLLGKDVLENENEKEIIKNIHVFICCIFGMVFFIGLEVFKT